MLYPLDSFSCIYFIVRLLYVQGDLRRVMGYITVKYFASLRELMGCSEERIPIHDNMSVRSVWERLILGRQIEDLNVLMAVNMDYVGPESIVHDGDEVAFFPPVTGG